MGCRVVASNLPASELETRQQRESIAGQPVANVHQLFHTAFPLEHFETTFLYHD
jgi:hypothetical protein